MKVLIVEDNKDKALDVASFLENEAKILNGSDISFAENLSDAVRAVSVEKYDLVILDLMLPYFSDGQADSQSGIEILRQMRKERGKNIATTVVGLSAFPDELENSRKAFEKYGILLTSYDSEGKWKDVVRRTAEHVLRNSGEKTKLDFLIFVALEEEYRGYANADIKFEERSTLFGLNMEFCTIGKERLLRGAIIRLRQMGLVAATLDVSAALAAFTVPIVCMSGICAGFSRNAAIGQLIVASPAWEYQAGKWSVNGFEIAPNQIQLRPKTRVTIEQAVDRHDIISYLEDGLPRKFSRPNLPEKPKLSPAVTGSAVIADAKRLTHIDIQHRKVAALDMETFGLYYSAHESHIEIEHFFSVKCVVDLADKKKADDYHEYGCAVSARAAVYFICCLTGAS